MIPLPLADVAAATGGTLHQVDDPSMQVTGPLSFDSRDIAPDGLFACLKDRALDGHTFAAQAVADGAVAALASRPVNAPAVIAKSFNNKIGGEFGSKEAIADAKAEIIRSLPGHGVAVLNADDPLVAAMAIRTTARTLTFGTTSACDVRADNIEVSSQGRPAFVLRHGSSHARVELSGIYGRHNVTNALTAAATAIAAGVPFDRIRRGLQAAKLSSGGRMEVLERAHDGVTIINDASNASPESVLAALDALAEHVLFRIANRFAIRPQDTKQHTDYAPMFLDWIFWCSLSTIELSDRLLARQTAQISTATP